MKPLVVGSLDRGAGKTSVIIGLAKALNKSFAYLKPFGDRLLYRKKRQWDYDSALLTNIFGLEELPELITLGFDHSKLRFMFDKDSIENRLRAMAEVVRQNRELFFIEGGCDLNFGASVHLDPIAVARSLEAQLILVLNGNEAGVGDQLAFIRNYLATDLVNFAGVIINSVKDMEEFESVHRADLESHGVPILGVLPHEAVLREYTVDYLAEQLFARVAAGDGGMQRKVRHIFVATTGLQTARRNPEFSAAGTLVVTSGDRSDIILAALDGDTAGILLTDEIAPPANIISTANDKDIPLLLVRQSTAKIGRKLAGLDPLITRDDTEKVELLGQLAAANVDLGFLD